MRSREKLKVERKEIKYNERTRKGELQETEKRKDKNGWKMGWRRTGNGRK